MTSFYLALAIETG